ncbi:hypothetical protein JTB14_012934 [Gonioctena quinquepunctata]|nr:hypothetical protein JTB14_012934 [Gonioctena quinquepunctata]
MQMPCREDHVQMIAHCRRAEEKEATPLFEPREWMTKKMTARSRKPREETPTLVFFVSWGKGESKTTAKGSGYRRLGFKNPLGEWNLFFPTPRGARKSVWAHNWGGENRRQKLGFPPNRREEGFLETKGGGRRRTNLGGDEDPCRK